MNLDAGLSTLDPAYARDQSSIWMTTQVFNGLVELDSSLQVQASIAKSWHISEDGKTYTFTLRDDVFFHKDPVFGPDSGRRVIAADFVYSFSRIYDQATASSGRWIFNGKIEGLEAFDEGKTGHISGFSAPDDTTLVIRLLRPFPPFLSLLAMPYAFAVPREAVEHYGDDFRAHPVGTGPFQYFRWEEGNILILHRNPAYFESDNGRPLPFLDAVVVRFIPSRLSAFVEFVQGNLDFINGVDDSYKDEVLHLDGTVKAAYADQFRVFLAPQLNTEYLGIQMDPELEITHGHPLADLRVRQALNHAIDREKLVKYLLNGMGYPANSGFVPKGMPGFDPEAVQGFRYDPQLSRELLDAAGFPGGKDFPVLELYSTPSYAGMAEFIQKSFEQIGIKLEIINLQGGAQRKEVYSGKVNFWRASWIADYPDGENYLSLFYSANHAPSGPNTTHFLDPEFDRLYEQALTETRDSARYRIYQQMDRLMLAQAPVIILYYDRILRINSRDIHGLSTNPMNHLVLKRVWKTENP